MIFNNLLFTLYDTEENIHVIDVCFLENFMTMAKKNP